MTKLITPSGALALYQGQFLSAVARKRLGKDLKPEKKLMYLGQRLRAMSPATIDPETTDDEETEPTETADDPE